MDDQKRLYQGHWWSRCEVGSIKHYILETEWCGREFFETIIKARKTSRYTCFESFKPNLSHLDQYCDTKNHVFCLVLTKHIFRYTVLKNNWFGKDFRYVSADASEKSNERFMVLGTDINGYRSIQDCKIHGLVRVLLLQVDLLPLSPPLASRVN